MEQMLLTKWISSSVILYWKALPIFGMALIWIFFTGFRTILKTKEQRFLREILLCICSFGLAFSFLCFGTYGLVDPANGLVRPNAVPVGAAKLAQFEWFGYLSLGFALAAGIALEISMRWKKKLPQRETLVD